MNIYQERFIDENDKLIGTSEYSNWLEQQLNTLEEQNKQMLDVKEKYYELIMTVENKYPNETRDETALRYIKERESRVDSGTGKKIEEIR